jgi:hypothetical protein
MVFCKKKRGHEADTGTQERSDNFRIAISA